jgi:hypothetical protein
MSNVQTNSMMSRTSVVLARYECGVLKTFPSSGLAGITELLHVPTELVLKFILCRKVCRARS